MSVRAAPESTRLRVLMLSPYFLPAEHGGGSVRATYNLCQHMRSHMTFVVAARDHDLNGLSPFDEASRAQARHATGLDIRYLPSGLPGVFAMRQLLREPFDLIYLNSLMAPDMALLALSMLRKRVGPPILVAPRGELLPGALAQRPLAKRVYLALLKAMGLLKGAHFHATSADEATSIRAALGSHAAVHIAADLPPITANAPVAQVPSARAPGPLRVLFLSRIDPIKNLGFALDVLAQVNTEVDFSIAGPIGHVGVWADCQQQLHRLPRQVRARYLGAVPHAQVYELLSCHDLLFLPTLGENHGYVVLEALSAGCAVLLSDRTPWRDLVALGVGADLPLNDKKAFVDMLMAQAAMSDTERRAQRARCLAHAHRHLGAADAAAAATRAMFEASA